MFYGSTVEHRQGSMISDPYESRHDMCLLRVLVSISFGFMTLNIIEKCSKVLKWRCNSVRIR